ncbi:MAG: CDP-diacylglycerol--glycerol-3-phosphate 3-phosphatidyltransferase [Treponema sp.]|jgi:CDP-diacylglycerol--glycerol-3-phosphate 3-phosphatidyltransferase|nr:CDP-diacylglycerol--glycerol-3-phosphate 3-phosphatidyltransferase [Treponema sp.]
MNLADKVTSLRLILAPFFFILYLFPEMGLFSWVSDDLRWTVPVLWVLFILSEITDLLDGKIARARHEVSDFGKLFDPFADVLVRITYFLCFVIDGILPALLFLVVLYREFGIQFLRNLMLKKGVVLGARKGGKLKAVTYMLAGAVALLAASAARFELDDAVILPLRTGAVVIFLISVVISVISFIDYVSVYNKTGK